MEETTLTLNRLFNFSDAALRTELSKYVVTTGMAAQLAAKAVHFSNESVAGDIAREIVRRCNVDVIELLAAAWNKEREIAKQMEKSRGSEEPEYVYVSERTVESKWPFIVEIKVIPLVYKIHLDLKIVLTLKIGEIKIEDGEITELIAGTISGEATMSIESAEIWKQECEPVDLIPMRLSKQLDVEQSKKHKAAV
jgi:hypothetical protein